MELEESTPQDAPGRQRPQSLSLAAALLCLFLMASPLATAQATSNSTEARELMAKVLDEMGGVENFRSLSGLRTQVRDGEYQTDDLVVCPDKVHYEFQIINDKDSFAFMMVASPAGGFSADRDRKGPSKPRDLKPKAVRDLVDGYCSQFVGMAVLFAAQHVTDPTSSFSLSGSERIGGVEAGVFDVNIAGSRSRWYVDPESGRLLRRSWTDSKGQVLMDDYSDWRTVGELTIPFRIRGTRGSKAFDTQYNAIEINPPADERFFGLPPVFLDPIHPAASTPAVARALLKVSSQPGGAQVFLNDAPRGSTDAQGNLTLRAPVGTYALKLTAPGYKDWTQPVTLAARGTTSIEARLTPPTAILHLSTRPGQAQAYLNDEFRGITSSEGNLTVASLAPASYRLRLTLIGYKEWTQTLTLEAGENRSIEAKLEPAGPKPLELGEVEEALKNGISPKRVAEMVKQFGVDFALTDEAEQRLRSSGADSDLLLAISRSKK